MSRRVNNEEDMFRVILKYFLTTKNHDTKKNLRKKYCQRNNSLTEYFRRAWIIYSVLEIIVDDKLNSDYKGSIRLRKNDIDSLINMVYASIRNFQYEYKTMDGRLEYNDLKKSKFEVKSDKEIRDEFGDDADDMIKSKNDNMMSLNRTKGSIVQLFKHSINIEYTVDTSYTNVPNQFFTNNHPTNRYVFKDVLYKILKDDDLFKTDETQFIEDADIREIIETYNGSDGYINSSSSKNHILMTTLKFLKKLGIITKDSLNPYEIVSFKDKEWRLSALTKVDSIEKILKNLDDVHKLTPKQKQYVIKIFQCSI